MLTWMAGVKDTFHELAEKLQDLNGLEGFYCKDLTTVIIHNKAYVLLEVHKIDKNGNCECYNAITFEHFTYHINDLDNDCLYGIGVEG